MVILQSKHQQTVIFLRHCFPRDAIHFQVPGETCLWNAQKMAGCRQFIAPHTKNDLNKNSEHHLART